MGMKINCMECGEITELDDWAELDECPECGSQDLEPDYSDINCDLPADYFVYLAGL